ncbi:MAG: cysteine--tRNA ligase [Candidatus Omnitrophota bacterium]|nr:cysteine--tRNA ligase [Candidatus Omnitrophota bacterium]
MSISIYNSLTRKKEEFVPLNPPQVNIYTCGVTVYDESHIGHARSLYIFDVIRRYLKYRGFNVNFVRNITDIDDKIINRSGELKIDWQELVGKYIALYKKDLENLGIQEGDCEPRATENITDMIKHIEGLIDKGFAYPTDSGVYFNVRKFKDYGKLSGQSIDQMLSGARIEPDETKQDPLDFALWKISKPDEPSWPSPWGQGRPGWHIECSVMSQKLLKTDTLDIHAGGRDLIFPHHENEIAQVEALTGKPFAKYWLHHGLLTINGQKMAKSLGNFVTIKDFIEQNGDLKLKLFFLSAHYHSPLDYNDNAIHIASENLETLGLFFREIEKYEKEGEIYKEAEDFKQRFITAMDDDFNTPVALSILLEMVSMGYKNINQNNIDVALSISKTLQDLLNILNVNEIKQTYRGFVTSEEIVDALINLQAKYKDKFAEYGIEFVTIDNEGDEIGNQQKLMESYISLRHLVKQKKDFKLADQIRNDLLEAKVILEDTKGGKTTWRAKL